MDPNLAGDQKDLALLMSMLILSADKDVGILSKSEIVKLN